MLEERSMYLEQQDSGNGFYTRNFTYKVMGIEGLRVPRVRKGPFCPVILPERRKTDIDFTENAIKRI